MTVQSAQQEEEQRLARSLEEIDRQLRGIGPRYFGDDYTEQLLDRQREERQQRLEIAAKEPYFGRIDYQADTEAASKPLYIGKAGVGGDESGDPLVIDWRAPIASLFYSFSGGEAPVTYESPDGEMTGEIHLKRNLLVRQRELVRVVDSYVRGVEQVSANDEFLLYRLGESKDNKLRDIVSTIQEEQDNIIRADRNRALFIQGVAGSGKTTVALHRLAYLLYRYAGRIAANRMIIFAPNTMFLDYISGVLPELGVGDIAQTTFADWSLALLQFEVSLVSSADTLEYWFEQERSAAEREEAPGRWKGRAAFRALLDERLAELERSLIPEAPFEPHPGLKLSPDKVKEWLDTDYGGDEPLMKRRERLASRVKRWLESEWKERRLTDKQAKTKANAKLNAYIKKMPSYSAPKLYRTLFDGKQAHPDIPKAIAKRTLQQLKLGVVDPEDLAPLVYLHIRMYGLDTALFDHIVIDEAQDYSPMQLEALRLCQRVPSFTILGDLQQGIHDYAGIRRWSEQMDLFESSSVGYYELDRSYRSTMEIIEFANRVLAGMEGGVKPATPVFRSGEPVTVTACEDTQWGAELVAAVSALLQQGIYQTIAVVGRTALECEAIHSLLESAGLQASLVQSKQPAYKGGLTVVPVYLSKGLEFDAVLIADASAQAYRDGDAKLLYVGCTRALHKLQLLHRGPLTPLVSDQA
ncbi:UvrD/Rep helicase family protein [Paenibacillus curdlanolyticus YK9]|uniref:UvrD/Rep helicase family protein n=1 Tax=Paenibacillus curdlanolyticus YK9 TaxID=717606 RepID=E0I695_9BACL|nr:UvrD-helicase domain-containing protein [Paenibacillus curdlanolyticus]EFM12487.1 UvrD/Rep helicase family protein [Paenibacillus curdlanolyticus YK9]